MNPDTLINPIIIYWDIDTSASDKDISGVCNEIVGAGIFVLNLSDHCVPLNKNTFRILDRLGGEKIKINLSVSSSVPEESMDIIRDAAVAKLYIDINSCEELKNSLEIIKRIKNEGWTTGVSFALDKNNFQDIPELLFMCIDNQIEDITFPIRRYDDGNIYYPDAEESGWLVNELKKTDIVNLNLSIHDPFLWRLFYSKENPDEEGCNGAKTMMYINKNLEVTPCPIFPFVIGNLRDSSLQDIFSSEARRKVRTEISIAPLECNSCRILSKCKGGCRGRAYTLFKGFDKKDPACLSAIHSRDAVD